MKDGREFLPKIPSRQTLERHSDLEAIFDIAGTMFCLCWDKLMESQTAEEGAVDLIYRADRDCCLQTHGRKGMLSVHSSCKIWGMSLGRIGAKSEVSNVTRHKRGINCAGISWRGMAWGSLESWLATSNPILPSDINKRQRQLSDSSSRSYSSPSIRYKVDRATGCDIEKE
jgi:hypothetical protein